MNEPLPNDLEERIRTLEFRNEVLHKANQKQQDEILDLRAKVRKLEHDAIQQFRNKEKCEHQKTYC